MVSNREISRLFDLFAELLLLHGKDERSSGLLSGAAYRIPRLDAEVLELQPARLKELFRPDIVRLLQELRKSGTIARLDELIQLTPPGLFEMMRIRGLGGKKLSILWKQAKIDSIDALLAAAKANELVAIPGFGAKTQANIITAIESYRNNVNRFHYATVADLAEDLVKGLQKTLNIKEVSICGEVRRQTITVAAIEIVAAVGVKRLTQKYLGKTLIVQSANTKLTRCHTIDEIPVTIYHVTKENFYTELFRLTGTEDHVTKVGRKIKRPGKYASEQAIYTAAKLPFIVPELREDVAEWDFIQQKGALLEVADIKGVVHNHTDWSDGVDSLPDFVNACKQKGFEYAVISDHSKNAHYAGGLKEAAVLRQLQQIDLLNRKVKPFHIFKSIECDIKVSGELDYDNSLLKQFDLVIVSIHQLLKMNEEKATRRLIKAIENPFTTILGHMTGRQLLIRPGYPVNYKRVIDACAANKVVIEVNANPYRLDMDWSHIPYAVSKNVMISIDPDAHSIEEIDNIRWGVSAARKGGLTKAMTWNAMPLHAITRWLKSRRKL